jgi:hypothetical protein
MKNNKWELNKLKFKINYLEHVDLVGFEIFDAGEGQMA